MQVKIQTVELKKSHLKQLDIKRGAEPGEVHENWVPLGRVSGRLVTDASDNSEYLLVQGRDTCFFISYNFAYAISTYGQDKRFDWNKLPKLIF